MENLNEKEKEKTIAQWEAADDADILSPLFALNLFRVKAWCKNKRGRYFTKDDNQLFKGIQLQKKNIHPFARAYLMNHFYTESYNRHAHRALDQEKLEFPFQLDQPIINGQRFFNMVSHYSESINEIMRSNKLEEIEKGNISFISRDKKSNSYRIFETIATYDNRNRQGDKYVRNLFHNAVFYYIDKFGTDMFEENVVKLFVWAYKLRVTSYAVKLASVDNYTREDIKLFRIIREAVSPVEIQEIYIAKILRTDLKGNEFKEDKMKKKVSEILILLEAFEYYTI